MKKLNTLQGFVQLGRYGVDKVPVENRVGEILTSPWYQLIFNLKSTIVYATFDFFKTKHYDPALLPITTGSVTSPMGLGSDSLPVQIDLFGEPTYLADSMQFHLEYLLRMANKGVFYIMPTFRGEDPDPRHLNQFLHIEAEIKGGLDEITALIDEYLCFLLKTIINAHGVEIEKHVGSLEHLQSLLLRKKDVFQRISFTEAVRVLKKQNTQYFNYLENKIIGLSNDGEKELLKKMGEGICLTHLPKIGVPFYQDDAQDGVHSLCADYLAGIGEFVGCGQRHTSYSQTILAMEERKVDPNEYEWYLQMKKEFPMQTAGFGLGLERFLLWILKHQDIRDIPLVSRLKGVRSNP